MERSKTQRQNTMHAEETTRVRGIEKTRGRERENEEERERESKFSLADSSGTKARGARQKERERERRQRRVAAWGGDYRAVNHPRWTFNSRIAIQQVCFGRWKSVPEIPESSLIPPRKYLRETREEVYEIRRGCTRFWFCAKERPSRSSRPIGQSSEWGLD